MEVIITKASRFDIYDDLNKRFLHKNITKRQLGKFLAENRTRKFRFVYSEKLPTKGEGDGTT